MTTNTNTPAPTRRDDALMAWDAWLRLIEQEMVVQLTHFGVTEIKSYTHPFDGPTFWLTGRFDDQMRRFSIGFEGADDGSWGMDAYAAVITEHDHGPIRLATKAIDDCEGLAPHMQNLQLTGVYGEHEADLGGGKWRTPQWPTWRAIALGRGLASLMVLWQCPTPALCTQNPK